MAGQRGSDRSPARPKSASTAAHHPPRRAALNAPPTQRHRPPSAATTTHGPSCPAKPADCNRSANAATPSTTCRPTTYRSRGNARPQASPSAWRTSASSAGHATAKRVQPEDPTPGEGPQQECPPTRLLGKVWVTHLYPG